MVFYRVPGDLHRARVNFGKLIANHFSKQGQDAADHQDGDQDVKRRVRFAFARRARSTHATINVARSRMKRN